MKKILYIIIPLLTILSGCTKDEIDMFGSVHGTIIDGAHQEPVSGALVTLSPSGKSTTTGSNGQYEFVGLEAGQYTVMVTKTNYATDSKSIAVTPGNTSIADFNIRTANGSIEISKPLLDFGSENTSLGFDIKNIGKNKLNYEIANNYDWLTISPTNGTIESTRITPIVVTIDRTKIIEDKEVKIPISSNAGSAEIIIKVTNANTAVVKLSKSVLEFNESISSLTFDITNKGKTNLTFNIPNNEEWMKITPNNGTITANGVKTIEVAIDRTKLTENRQTKLAVVTNVGSCELDIIINGYGSDASPELHLSATTLDFGTSTSILEFNVMNIGTGTLSWYLSSIDEAWLGATPTIGNTESGESTKVTITVDRTKVTTSSTATIIVNGSMQSKSVIVNVQPSSGGGGGGDNGDYSSATIIQCDAKVEAKIVSCIRTGNSVKFTYTLTNHGLGMQVNDFRIYPPSSPSLISGAYRSVVSDNIGTEYLYPTMTFRNASTAISQIISTNFPENVASQGTVVINDVPTDANKLNVMLGVYVYNLNGFKLMDNRIFFKNIPIY